MKIGMSNRRYAIVEEISVQKETRDMGKKIFYVALRGLWLGPSYSLAECLSIS